VALPNLNFPPSAPSFRDDWNSFRLSESQLRVKLQRTLRRGSRNRELRHTDDDLSREEPVNLDVELK